MERICLTCLTSNRQLYDLNKLRYLIIDIKLFELKNIEGSICWECRNIIVKFHKFIMKIKRSQELLTRNLMIPLTSLVSETKSIYDIEYYHDLDDDINVGTFEGKSEKEELTFDMAHEFCDDAEQTNMEHTYVDTIKKDSLKKEKHLKQRKHKHKLKCDDDAKVKEKFTKVVFTDKEMIQHREDKRSQPNFKKIPYKCYMCVLGFTRKETHDLHMQKKHSETKGDFICNICKTRLPTKKSIEKHLQKHYVSYRCKLCKYETVEMWSAINHCKVKHRDDTEDNIHCTQCELVARTPEELSDHIRTQHTLHCSECGEKFKGKHTLRTHKSRIHAIKREFICDFCTKTFTTKTRLESHMATHNTAIAKKLSYCTVCNIQYKNIYVYRNHLKNSANHSERLYPCSQCNKKFASKVYWTMHYNFYHLQKSQYKCEICNKLFISDWRLKNHKQKHHGLTRSRDHPCNICGKKFYTLSTLRGHKLTHSEQRTYMCEDCGDTFKQRPALYTHSRLVHRQNNSV